MESPLAAIKVSLFYVVKKLPESFKYNLVSIKAVYHKVLLSVLTEEVLGYSSSKSLVEFWNFVPVTTVSDQGPTCSVIQFIR